MSLTVDWQKTQQLPAPLLFVCIVLFSLGFSPRVAADDLFTSQVLPILRESCFECHSHAAGESSGGLVLDSLAAMKAGGARGTVISEDTTDASKSLLLQALTYDAPDLQMPPDEKLSEEKIAAVRQWLQSGAPVPENFVGQATTPIRNDAWRSHWSYQPIPSWDDITAALTATSAGPASSNPVDVLIGEKLALAGLMPSPPADAETLLWRITHDLTGLPPNYLQAEIARNVESGSSEGFVDDLIELQLASPHFGERWARHWMDVARYADNKGYVFREDREYPEAYKYRDWLIKSFNQDLPFDRFVKLQLAADLVSDATAEDVAALGFLTLGRRFLNNKHDIIDDRIDVMSRGLMGMTLACARCHDHKYDPASQADYYALYGVFQNSHEPGGEPWPHRLAEKDKFSDAHIFIRGVAGRRGKKVPRRFVSFLSESEPAEFKVGSGRLELAERIASSDNPLTARVIANRVWMQLMGTPLVSTPSDFGLRSERPVQMQLLDTLAAYLIEKRWSQKELIRLIVSSDTYQQRSVSRADCVDKDPENTLYWKANRKRRDFESLRDTLLAAAKVIDLSILGKSERIDAEVLMKRRTLYAYIDRQNLPSVFRTFDIASPDVHTPRRAQTSVPQQGLYFLNSDFSAKLARRLSGQLKEQLPDASDVKRVHWAFSMVLARHATEAEIQGAVELVDYADANPIEAPPATWTYGYASFDPANNQAGEFMELPHYQPTAWQGGPSMPDPQLGWCQLTPTGGHPGNDLEHAVVRRWTAPSDGAISVSGRLQHKQKGGDGVRCSIIHRSSGSLAGQWTAANKRIITNVKHIDVKEGDHVDFITDCITGPGFDSFEWKVKINHHPSGKQSSSEKGFTGRVAKPLDGWATLCQALLASNELAFVD
ncbi:MAG: PSD1 and planctomycete cytochrome C domain-containing protein [Aureliella sp.]